MQKSGKTNRINEIRLQNIQNLNVKAAYAVTEACELVTKSWIKWAK